VTPESFPAAPWHAGSRLAVLANEENWGYDRLAEAAAAKAELLRAHGLIPGEVVVVAEDPGLDLVLMQHALARCGAALLPVAAALEPESRQRLASLAGAEWAWSPGRPGRLDRLTRDQVTPAPWTGSPLALVVATSGSSGTPKAVMLTQANLLASCALVIARLGLREGDLWLCCLPRHHIGGLAIAYRCALAGAALLLHPIFDAPSVAAALDRYPVTHISLVPPMLARLLDQGTAPPASLRVALIGGQGLGGALARRALGAGWPLRLTYGMTETGSQVATSGPLACPPESGVVGTPLPGLTLNCPRCDEPTRALCLKGDLVMAGYANPNRSPGLGLKDGWLVTADLACLTREGELRVLGRADGALVIGGVQVYPDLIAARLLTAPGVREAVTIGLADPTWGGRLVVAYVGEATEASLAAWCRGHLPGPQGPRTFKCLEALPRLASGKPDLCRIRRLLGVG
jgi:o-succinylbenzoate---CoA ligase